MLKLGCPTSSLALTAVDLETKSLEGWGSDSVLSPEAPLDPEKLGAQLSNAAQGLAFSHACWAFPLRSGPSRWPWVLGSLPSPLTVTSVGSLPD